MIQTTTKQVNHKEVLQASRTMVDIWNKGYVWNGWFTPGADNRIILRSAVDIAVTVTATMAEKRAAATDLAGYYEYITGQVPEQIQIDRLNEWIRTGYEYESYPVYDESDDQRRTVLTGAEKYESISDNYAIEKAGLRADGIALNGRVKKAVEIFDIDAEFDRKRIKVRF
ncbi:hypothetical protein [Paenibacillus sp. LPE1-1-1.1]|uniref:hypothetical protein n=1 Tax=Paenibacillus sp. LPE1-1-1.1 TaxID=3135230 RepID=UPI00342E4AA4